MFIHYLPFISENYIYASTKICWVSVNYKIILKCFKLVIADMLMTMEFKQFHLVLHIFNYLLIFSTQVYGTVSGYIILFIMIYFQSQIICRTFVQGDYHITLKDIKCFENKELIWNLTCTCYNKYVGNSTYSVDGNINPNLSIKPVLVRRAISNYQKKNSSNNRSNLICR